MRGATHMHVRLERPRYLLVACGGGWEGGRGVAAVRRTNALLNLALAR